MSTTTKFVFEPGDTFEVTGTVRNGKRFKLTTNSIRQAKSVNVIKGTRWLIRDGKRSVIGRIA